MSSSDAKRSLTRRQFGAGTLATVGASTVGRLAAQETVAADSTVLADYAHRSDPATRVEPMAEGDVAGGRGEIDAFRRHAVHEVSRLR